ncbi:MAG: hypothetical protein RIF33_23615 [Cyclobacteriaceae bacterium]
MKNLLIAMSLLLSTALSAQNSNLPYADISETPKDYNIGNFASRMVDGLGFRFYWATEGLTAENVAYRPSAEARSIEETIDHIVSLTTILKNAVMKRPTTFPIDLDGPDFWEKRAMILDNIEDSSGILADSESADFEDYEMTFVYPDGNSVTYPFWNLINGPIEDAVWHTGQVVSLRRSAGNPFDGKVSVLQGIYKKD